MTKNNSYLFVLRAWSEDGRWRWSLLKNGADERIGFPNLDELYIYLSAMTSGSDEEQNQDRELDKR